MAETSCFSPKQMIYVCTNKESLVSVAIYGFTVLNPSVVVPRQNNVRNALNINLAESDYGDKELPNAKLFLPPIIHK